MPAISAPEPYILWLTGAGILIALVAWLPLALKRLPLSLPIICIAIGAAIFSLPAVALADAMPEGPAKEAMEQKADVVEEQGEEKANAMDDKGEIAPSETGVGDTQKK